MNLFPQTLSGAIQDISFFINDFTLVGTKIHPLLFY